MKLILHELANFDSFDPLLITSAYPGSGKSTLAISLVNQIKEQDSNIDIKLYQLDELYMFLRIDKWFPKEVLHMNIMEFEQFLKNKTYKSHRKESQLLCIQFLKEKYPELYNKLYKHRFGEEFFLIDKNYHNNSIWKEWTKYVLQYCRYDYKGLAIVEGGQLSSYLLESNDYETFIIVNTPKIKSFFQKIKRDVEQYNPNSFNFIKKIKIYYNFIKRFFNKKDRLWKIINDGVKNIKRLCERYEYRLSYIEVPDDCKIEFKNERLKFLNLIQKKEPKKSTLLSKLRWGDKMFAIWIIALISRIFIRNSTYDITLFCIASFFIIINSLKEIKRLKERN